MLNKVKIPRFCFNPNLFNSWRTTGRFSERYASRKSKNGVYRRRYNHQLDKEFDSPNTLNFTKTSRLCYAGHMIRKPKDLPQKALFRVKPNGRRNQGRPKSRWADGGKSDSLALGLKTGSHGEIFFNGPCPVLVVVSHNLESK
jgi:hypothetical protein